MPITAGHHSGPGYLMMKGANMQEFTFWQSAQLQKPIARNTGQNRRYDLKLDWAEADNAIAEAAKWPIFSATESQLGLRLDAAKGRSKCW